MNLVLIQASAEGYYSENTYEEGIFITEESYEKIKDVEIGVCICELDGKHSEVEADIVITKYTEEELLGTDIEIDSDGESLYYPLEEIFENYGLDLDQEVRYVKEYLNTLDTYITLEVIVKKSQIGKVREFVKNLQNL